MAAVPEPLRALLPEDSALADLQTLEEAQIRVSQGLRTGCNRFFYVTMLAENNDGTATIEASESFQKRGLKCRKGPCGLYCIGRQTCRDSHEARYQVRVFLIYHTGCCLKIRKRF